MYSYILGLIELSRLHSEMSDLASHQSLLEVGLNQVQCLWNWNLVTHCNKLRWVLVFIVITLVLRLRGLQ